MRDTYVSWSCFIVLEMVFKLLMLLELLEENEEEI